MEGFGRPISAVTLSLAMLLFPSTALPAVMRRLAQYRQSVEDE
jgi:hypothetical protein